MSIGNNLPEAWNWLSQLPHHITKEQLAQAKSLVPNLFKEALHVSAPFIPPDLAARFVYLIADESDPESLYQNLEVIRAKSLWDRHNESAMDLSSGSSTAEYDNFVQNQYNYSALGLFADLYPEKLEGLLQDQFLFKLAGSASPFLEHLFQEATHNGIVLEILSRHIMERDKDGNTFLHTLLKVPGNTAVLSALSRNPSLFSPLLLAVNNNGNTVTEELLQEPEGLKNLLLEQAAYGNYDLLKDCFYHDPDFVRELVYQSSFEGASDLLTLIINQGRDDMFRFVCKIFRTDPEDGAFFDGEDDFQIPSLEIEGWNIGAEYIIDKDFSSFVIEHHLKDLLSKPHFMDLVVFFLYSDNFIYEIIQNIITQDNYTHLNVFFLGQNRNPDYLKRVALAAVSNTYDIPFGVGDSVVGGLSFFEVLLLKGGYPAAARLLNELDRDTFIVLAGQDNHLIVKNSQGVDETLELPFIFSPLLREKEPELIKILQHLFYLFPERMVAIANNVEGDSDRTAFHRALATQNLTPALCDLFLIHEFTKGAFIKLLRRADNQEKTPVHTMYEQLNPFLYNYLDSLTDQNFAFNCKKEIRKAVFKDLRTFTRMAIEGLRKTLSANYFVINDRDFKLGMSLHLIGKGGLEELLPRTIREYLRDFKQVNKESLELEVDLIRGDLNILTEKYKHRTEFFQSEMNNLIKRMPTFRSLIEKIYKQVTGSALAPAEKKKKSPMDITDD